MRLYRENFIFVDIIAMSNKNEKIKRDNPVAGYDFRWNAENLSHTEIIDILSVLQKSTASN